MDEFVIEGLSTRRINRSSSGRAMRREFTLGSVITNPANTVTHSNAYFDDESILDDEPDIGVIGKGEAD